MSDVFNRRYTADEISAIVHRALERSGGSDDSLSYDDLAETAREMGISTEQLHSAIREESDETALESARARVKLRKREEFFQHLRAYCIINGALFLINLLGDGLTHPWVVFPMIGWGIGLAFHASSVYYPDSRGVDKAARRLIRRESRVSRDGRMYVHIQARGRKQACR